MAVFSSRVRKLAEHDARIGTLPLEVKIIDMSIKLFGILYGRTTDKHRLQLVQHFLNYTKQYKAPNKLSININIMTAFLYGLKVTVPAFGRSIRLGYDS